MKLPPYPQGWYALAYSDELAPGAALPVTAFGREWVVFRAAGGEPRVLDAVCPHLGAHLGHGGCVDGDSIACPFHKWRFDGAGRCVDMPYAQKIRARARVQPLIARDASGFLLVWHDPSGAPPAWEPPNLPEIGAAAWTPIARRQWRVRTHVQETNENNCDSAHLRFVHGLIEPTSTAHADGATF